MGPGVLVPNNPDLATILGDTDVDFESFHFLLIFLVPRFPDRAWARLGPGLGWAWAGLGLRGLGLGPGPLGQWLPISVFFRSMAKFIKNGQIRANISTPPSGPRV